MPDCHRFMKGMLSQNRNIFTLTLKTATKLLALRVSRKYEIIIRGINAELHRYSGTTACISSN